MWPETVLDRFMEQCPAAVMVRATLENLVSPERLDQIFAETSQRQYERELLFSQVVALMVGVATRTHTSVHAGRTWRPRIGWAFRRPRCMAS